jgi:hypothetical protein
VESDRIVESGGGLIVHQVCMRVGGQSFIWNRIFYR